MAGRFCQECGAANEAIAMYCVKCGAVLKSGVPPAAPPAYAPSSYAPPGYAPPGYPPYPYSYPTYDYAGMDRQKRIDRTKTGVLLLLIGFAIGWLPVIGAIGGLLSLIGAILVILGRKAFGATHSRNVWVSVALYIVGIVGVVALAVWFAIAVINVGPGNPAQIGPIFTSFVTGLVIITAISGLASVLFTYALQTTPGRILLWAGYAADLAVNALLAVLIFGLVSSNANLDALNAQITSLALLSAIPALLFAGAYYIVWQRIARGELPARAPMPATPMVWLPAASALAAPPTAPPPPGPPFPPQGPP